MDLPPIILDQLIAHVEQAEGFRAEAYHCPAGYLTIGYGHRVDGPMGPISRMQAEDLLRADLGRVYRETLELAPELREHPGPLAALMDLIYTTGPAAVRGTQTLEAFRRGAWREAAIRYRRWVYAHVGGRPTRLPGLVTRRDRAARLWLDPLATNPSGGLKA
jgi:lysozyme